MLQEFLHGSTNIILFVGAIYMQMWMTVFWEKYIHERSDIVKTILLRQLRARMYIYSQILI